MRVNVGDPTAVTSAERHRALAREAGSRGDDAAAITHIAAACAFDGDPRDWLALGERAGGEDAAHALAEALDALEHPDLPDDAVAEVALRVAERANAIDDPVVASDALSEALRARPSDELRRRFVRALRAADGEDDAAEPYRAGRNDPCPCGSGRKFKRCHGEAAVPAAAPRSSEGALLLRLVSPYVDLDLEGAVDMLGAGVATRGRRLSPLGAGTRGSPGTPRHDRDALPGGRASC